MKSPKPDLHHILQQIENIIGGKQLAEQVVVSRKEKLNSEGVCKAYLEVTDRRYSTNPEKYTIEENDEVSVFIAFPITASLDKHHPNYLAFQDILTGLTGTARVALVKFETPASAQFAVGELIRWTNNQTSLSREAGQVISHLHLFRVMHYDNIQAECVARKLILPPSSP
jgi:hypothetical protein